jgi:hypothetical protein
MPLEEGDGPCFGTLASSSQWGRIMTHGQDQIAEGRSREPRERAQIPHRGPPTAFSRVKAQSYTETRALAD